jgi:hypothetical protein
LEHQPGYKQANYNEAKITNYNEAMKQTANYLCCCQPKFLHSCLRMMNVFHRFAYITNLIRENRQPILNNEVHDMTATPLMKDVSICWKCILLQKMKQFST